MTKLKCQTKLKAQMTNDKIVSLNFGFWILAFLCPLLFGFWHSAIVYASTQTYSFPLSFSDGSTAKLTLPFDELRSITQIDLGGDGTSEILIGSPSGIIGKVYLARLDGSIINSWEAYDARFSGGVNVAAGDLDQDNIPEIITAPAGGGGPHVRIFNGFGIPKINPGFFADDRTYRNGVHIAIQKFEQNEPASISAILKKDGKEIFKAFTPSGNLIKTYPIPLEQEETGKTINIAIQKNNQALSLSVPEKARAIESNEKTIIIDLSDQSFSYYENGFRISTFKTSTGRYGYKTPIGEHKILNKSKLAYSKTYGLYMPFWMAFTSRGHGIHELPYWPSGYREGEDHLGTAVSHGCVRLGVGSAEEVFNWADIGTKIIVQE
ncbi:MAG: hypothetical protein COV79_00490 [Parcubacteria group bacterium CG11_big_fil_rev_8_21_14_0_20_41_14]|nr:MAG: hypothetical protein COV79_00490 [Parcubacteria group bacterium CG11_big_fil_rev_8_21_14_0_20_41_14]PIZ81384.1 MAG: hypothetical protein COY02_02315 [Parcubacteria group bacterium CG_4_10_14_0_2_um_filter_41_6]